MANYSKKKPAFRSKAEMYKKSKWVKFRESLEMFFSNLKRFFLKMGHKVNEKGSQKLTIMIVPHNEKKIFNIQISNYIMFFVMVILIVTVTTAVATISNYQLMNKKVTELDTQNQDNQSRIEEYQRSIDNLGDRFTHFKTDISSLLESTGRSGDIFNVPNIEVLGGNTNANTPQEVRDLERLGMELEIIKKNIWRVSTFIADKQKLLTEIPSIYPLATRARITSPFGYRVDPIYHSETKFHEGIDLATFPGTPVFATADGEISQAGWSGGYGLVIKIAHKYGFETRYAHLQSFAPGIMVGERVKQGQVIAYLGTSGDRRGIIYITK
jgi:murein DD-endopeptidase MepM/ murein hydrolase activator NlpD